MITDTKICVYRIINELPFCRATHYKYLCEIPASGHNMPLNEGRYGLLQNLAAWLDGMDGILH